MNQADNARSLNDAGAPTNTTAASESSRTETEVIYTVVINDEAQYSIWPTFRAVPAGWREVGVSGPMDACLAHIDIVWTDMRPASLRRFMDQ